MLSVPLGLCQDWHRRGTCACVIFGSVAIHNTWIFFVTCLFCIFRVDLIRVDLKNNLRTQTKDGVAPVRTVFNLQWSGELELRFPKKRSKPRPKMNIQKPLVQLEENNHSGCQSQGPCEFWRATISWGELFHGSTSCVKIETDLVFKALEPSTLYGSQEDTPNDSHGSGTPFA